MRKTTTKFGFLVGLGAIIVACSSGSTGVKAPTPSDSGTCGGFASPDPACNACLTTACCTEGTTCNANTACAAISNCVQACTDETCARGCLTANPAGTADYNSLTGCVSNNCTSECGGTAGADAGACGFAFNTDACQSCFTSSCCSVGATCAGNAECVALDDCVGNCAGGDTACENACATAHPTGTAALNAVGSCLTGPCGAACGFGPTDGGPACGGFSSTDACLNKCITSTCCSQSAACGQSASCLTLFDCLGHCSASDSACITACGNASPAGVTPYNAMSTCQTSCGCAVPDAGTADGGDGG